MGAYNAAGRAVDGSRSILLDRDLPAGVFLNGSAGDDLAVAGLDADANDAKMPSADIGDFTPGVPLIKVAPNER